MDVNENKTCPLCHNHCPLSAPRCRKGERYAQGDYESEGRIFEGRERPAMPEMEADGSLMAKLRRCAHYLRQFSESGGSQLRVLQILGQSEELSQRELMDMVGVQPGSLSELLGKLEAKGYIQRSKNEADKRNVDIKLTQRGREVLEQARGSRGSDSENLFAALSEEEEDLLGAILDKLLAAWKDLPESGAFGEGRGFHRRGDRNRAEREARGNYEEREARGNHEQREAHGNHERHVDTGTQENRRGFQPGPGQPGPFGRNDEERPHGDRHNRGGRGRDR